jgi:hypothetical protein
MVTLVQSHLCALSAAAVSFAFVRRVLLRQNADAQQRQQKQHMQQHSAR